jgi:uncharacterized protein (DUF58 family)
MALTGRAAAAALLGALAVLGFRTWAALVAVNAVLLAAILADLMLAASVRRLGVTRSGDTRVLLGESAPVAVTVHNPDHHPLRAQLRAAWPPSAHPEPGQVALVAAAGGCGHGQHAHPDRRGDKVSPRYHALVRAAGPGRPAGPPRRALERTGAAAVRQPQAPGREALPAAPARRPAPLAAARPGTEFDSLREYVIGDDVRSIDWRAAARRGDVMVRTWRPERDRRILIVLDTGRTSAGRVGGIPRLDASMDATLLLTALAARAGDRVDLIAFDRRVRARVLGAPRSSVLASFTTAMAPLDAELTETDLAAMVSAVLTVARHRCLVILLTELNPAVIEEGLLPRLGPLVSRDMVMIAAVADPRIAEMAAARGDAASLYDAAAAEGALAQRRQISALLRSQGVSVVDAPPDRLPSALADAYLDLKASGRL